MLIRPALASDHDAWLKMVLDYDGDVAAQASQAWRQIFDPTSSARCLIATVDDVPAAFMHYLMHDFCFKSDPVCYLADLYVAPEYRRRGIARALLERLVVTARESGWSRIYWVTEPDNPARGLYDKLAIAGFVRYHLDL